MNLELEKPVLFQTRFKIVKMVKFFTCHAQVHFYTEAPTILALIHLQIHLGRKFLSNVCFFKELIGRTSLVSLRICRLGINFWKVKKGAFCVWNQTIRAETVLKLNLVFIEKVCIFWQFKATLKFRKLNRKIREELQLLRIMHQLFHQFYCKRLKNILENWLNKK